MINWYVASPFKRLNFFGPKSAAVDQKRGTGMAGPLKITHQRPS